LKELQFRNKRLNPPYRTVTRLYFLPVTAMRRTQRSDAERVERASRYLAALRMMLRYAFVAITHSYTHARAHSPVTDHFQAPMRTVDEKRSIDSDTALYIHSIFLYSSFLFFYNRLR